MKSLFCRRLVRLLAYISQTYVYASCCAEFAGSEFRSTFHVQFLASTRGSVQKKVCEPTRGISQRMILQSWVGPVWGRSSSTFERTRTILARTHPLKIFQQDSCQQSSRFCRKIYRMAYTYSIFWGSGSSIWGREIDGAEVEYNM